jgi:hypothetical protein
MMVPFAVPKFRLKMQLFNAILLIIVNTDRF